MSISSKAVTTSWVDELKVTPVMIFASEYPERTKHLDSFLRILSYSQAWFKDKIKKTFYLTTPILLKSNKSAADWNYIVNQLLLEGHRYDYHDAVKEELIKAGLNGNWDGTTYNKYIAVVYTGKQKIATWGASSTGEYMIITPIATKEKCVKFTTNNKPAIHRESAEAVYAVCHEMGHCLGGLRLHSCEYIPKQINCENSFMQFGQPPNMIMLPSELKAMEQSHFLR